MTKNTANIGLPYQFAKKNRLACQWSETDEKSIDVFYQKPLAYSALMEIQRCYSYSTNLIALNDEAFQKQLADIYRANTSLTDATSDMGATLDLTQLADDIPSTADLLDNESDAPVIRLINALFNQAIQMGASDIHIETFEQDVIVRQRVDGILVEVLDIPRSAAPFVISRIKVMANLDIAEKRVPQDGRISLRIGQHNIDVRVSTLPSNHGERIVLRILDKQAIELQLSSLGMSAEHTARVNELIHNPNGIILVTGPTGSGKTTSLYAMISELNQISRNILTIEDPIEYDLAGIGQTQVNPKVNMTFAQGLRAILRQDPDVVMVGEIRDHETASIAIQASLTGHLVLSTLHTNSGLGAIMRLLDMGVESFLLSSSLTGLIAQRLVRKLCDKCKKPHTLSADELKFFPSDWAVPETIFINQGCEHCHGSGYDGRTGVYEIIAVDGPLKQMIHRGDSQQQLEQYVRQTCQSMRANGLQKVIAGETTLAEVLRVT